MSCRINAISGLVSLLLISSAGALAQDSPSKSLACDADCARGNAENASRACAPRIEALAPTDFQWVQRPYGGIFQKAEPADTTVVRYTGDYIRFLSPQKEWVRITYECFYDSVVQTVRTVRVRLGRIGAPAAGQQAAPSMSRQSVEGERNRAAAVPDAAGPQAASDRTTSPKTRPRAGEPSEIEILQVNPRSRAANS
jgi:hypothetical protein